MFQLFSKPIRDPIGSPLKDYPDDIIVNKAKALIEQSKTLKQLNTAKRYIDLFTVNNISRSQIKEELMILWTEKDKNLSVVE
jgi:hypothetical protein